MTERMCNNTIKQCGGYSEAKKGEPGVCLYSFSDSGVIERPAGHNSNGILPMGKVKKFGKSGFFEKLMEEAKRGVDYGKELERLREKYRRRIADLRWEISGGKMPNLVWRLPGWMSEPATYYCGIITKAEACENIKKPGHSKTYKVIPYSCYNIGCPECYEKASKREAMHIEERILGLDKAWKDIKEKIGVPIHIILSPPQKEAKELIMVREGLDLLFKQVVEYLNTLGIHGGVIIFHAFRRVGIWDNEEEEDPDKVKGGKWYLSPHFHVIGFGWVRVGSKEFYERTGWVYKNKGVRLNLYGTIFYLLTHYGLAYTEGGERRAKHSIRWFGSFSYGVARVEEGERRYMKCPECGGKMMHWDVGECKDKKEYSDIENWEEMDYIRLEPVKMYRIRLRRERDRGGMSLNNDKG